MQECGDVLRELVAALLDLDVNEITSCVIQNPIQLGRALEDKDCFLDIRLTLNNKKVINLEMQAWKDVHWVNRSVLYLCRIFDSLKVGEDYSLLKPVYHIGILNAEIFPDSREFYAEYQLINRKTGALYTDLLSLRVLDLTKTAYAGDTAQDQRLAKWARIFRAKTMKELEALSQESEVFQTMVTHLKKLTEDEENRLQMEAREDYERRMAGQYRAGMEQGIQIGEERGIQIGEERGIQIGQAKSIIDLLSALGDVSESLKAEILRVTDPQILRKLTRSAARAESIEAFKTTLNEL